MTPEDKLKPWSESIEYPSAIQMGYLRSFLESFDWWNLVPVPSDDKSFIPAAKAFAHAKTDGIRLLYFYSKETATGELADIQAGATVQLTWFNPRTGEKAEPLSVTAGQDGRLTLPERPDGEDWILMIV